MTNNTITEKERELLMNIFSGSPFNGDKIDITKSYEENTEHFENGENWTAIADASDFGYKTKKQFSGLCSSLEAKGMIALCEDEDGDGRPMSWIIIGEEEFAIIKKAW